MYIKSTHRLEFSNGQETFVTTGGNVEQEAPDWIAEDDYFKANLADGRVTNLSAYGTQAATGNSPFGEDTVIDGLSIYDFRFPAVNYVEAVSEELYAQILETITEGGLDFTEFSDPNRVTLIGDQYVRNAVLQEIEKRLVEGMANLTEAVTPAKPKRGTKKQSEASSAETQPTEPNPAESDNPGSEGDSEAQTEQGKQVIDTGIPGF